MIDAKLGQPYTILKRVPEGALIGTADGLTGFASKGVLERAPHLFTGEAIAAPPRIPDCFNLPTFPAPSDDADVITVTPQRYEIQGHEVEAGYSPELRRWLVARS